jgi:hypothetical protein
MKGDVGTTTKLAGEAAETANVARDQIVRCAEAFAELGAYLRRRPPRLVVTCARGSSDHAATYGKYLIETTVGHVVASVGPSVASIYDARHLNLADALFIAVSQSGQSPDLLRLTQAARDAGAFVVGFVNDGIALGLVPACRSAPAPSGVSPRPNRTSLPRSPFCSWWRTGRGVTRCSTRSLAFRVFSRRHARSIGGRHFRLSPERRACSCWDEALGSELRWKWRSS